MPRWTRRISASSNQRVICSTLWSLARSRAPKPHTGTSRKTVTPGLLRESSRMAHSSRRGSSLTERSPLSRTCSRGSGKREQTRILGWTGGTRWSTRQTQAMPSELTRDWSNPVTSRTPLSSWTSMRIYINMLTSLTKHLGDSSTPLWTRAVKILDWRKVASSRPRGPAYRPPQ